MPTNTIDFQNRLALKTILRIEKFENGPSRHIAPPHQLGHYREKADVAFVASRRWFCGYTTWDAASKRLSRQI